MEHTESEREPIEQLAEDFAERQRLGERPTIQEYIDKHPGLADEIRELFPALQIMERLKPDAGDAAPATSDAAGGKHPKLLGDYRILRQVGCGGMGTVYEAEQQSLGRRVALKVLSHHLLVNEKQKRRFEHEARAAARLHHTNIVPVFGIGEHDGVYYYVMQFIRGHAVDEVLAEVRRLRDEDNSSRNHERADNTERPFDEPTAKCGLEGFQPVAPAQRAALSLVTGQFEREKLLDSANAPVDASASEAGGRPPFESAEVEACEDEQGNLPIGGVSLSSSSLSLFDTSGSSSWSKSRSTYFRSVARIGLQVADALHYAHEQGVLHRDIKPSNLILDAQGTVWVTDFGLAKAEDQQSLTQTGDIVGTLRYMAPEMLSGRADVRSDVCELGLTLYEMLALQPAFNKIARAQLVRQVMNAELPHVQTLDANVPRDLATIVHKAIDYEPGRRYQTAAELREDLNRFLEDEPIKARRISLVSRCGHWCKRNPVVASLTGTVATLLLVGAIVSSAAAYRFRTLAHELVQKKAEAEAARDNARAARDESLRNLGQAYRAQAQASRWSGRSGQRLDSLDALAKAAKLVPRLGLDTEQVLKIRNDAVACMALVDLRIVSTWKGLGPPSSVDFSADLASYAGLDRDAELCIWDATRRQAIARLPGAGTPVALRFSPHGRFLAAECRSEKGADMVVWDLASREVIISDVPADRHDWPADFSPDGQRVAFGAADGSIRIYDLAAGTESARLTPDVEPNEPNHVRFHPDGRRLGVSSYVGRNVQIWDVETGRVLQTLAHQKMVRGIDWRADGKLLAAASDCRIHVWDVESGTERYVLEGHKSAVHHVAFHPNQNILVSHAWDATTRLWSLADGRQLLSTEGCFLRFDPEGRYLAFEDGRQLGLWEMATGAECQVLYGSETLTEDIHTVAISPGGRLMATGSNNYGSGLRLWDLATCTEVAELATGRVPWMKFHMSEGSLVTSSHRGLYKWPITQQTASNRVLIGPPVTMAKPTGVGAMDMTPNAGTIVVDGFSGRHAAVIQPSLAKKTILAGGSQRMYIAVSPDGKLVARGNYQADDVEIWNGQTGKLLRTLPIGGTATVAFTPDGRWLVTAAAEYQFWNIESWQPERVIRDAGLDIGGRMAFSPDGEVLAITLSHGLVRLIAYHTGRVLADLEPTPRPARVQGLCFSPDGGQLVTTCGTEGIRVWDLRRIRERLAAMDLDWEMPPYPPATEVANLKPLDVEVDQGPLAGADHRELSQDHAKAGRWKEAIEAASKAIELYHLDVEALRLRARAHVAVKRYDQAVADFRWELEAWKKLADTRAYMLPTSVLQAEAHHQLGHLLERLNRPEEATDHFRQALRHFEGLGDDARREAASGSLACGEVIELPLPIEGKPLGEWVTTGDPKKRLQQTVVLETLRDWPVIMEAGWRLTRAVRITGAQGAHYNHHDGQLYLARKVSGNPGQLYCLAADGQATRLTSPGHPKGGIFSVAIDHQNGHVFFGDYLSGNIFRTARGSTDGEKWVSEFKAGDSDPVGIAFASTDFASDVLAPGEGIVVDEGGGGIPGPNAIYRFSSECPEGETLLYSDGPDEGPLVAPRDVAIGKAGVYVVDTGGSDPGAIYELDGDGSLTLLSTSQAIDDPVGVAVDPTTEELLVADAGGDRVVRVDPQTGEVANVVTGLPFWTMSAACLDVSPDGGQLFVTVPDTIFAFRREASRKLGAGRQSRQPKAGSEP